MSQPSNESQPVGTKWDLRAIALLVAIAAGVILLVYQVFAIRSLRGDLGRQAESHAAALKQKAQDDAVLVAEALAVTLDPLIYASASDDRTTLNAIANAIVRNNRIEQFIVTDPMGRVLATSDANFADQFLPELVKERRAVTADGKSFVVTRPIEHDTTALGFLRIKVR